MNTNDNLTKRDTKALLSTVWIFVMFNVFTRDIHELFRPGLLEEMMTGVVNGVRTSEGLLLIGGVMMEILIVMVLLSRVLQYRVNRWANVVVGIASIPLILSSGVHDMDDIFFASINIASLLFIVWYAWRWRNVEAT